MGLAIRVRIYVLASRLVQRNVLAELLDRKPYLLVVIFQIHIDALETSIILILQDFMLLMVFFCCNNVFSFFVFFL